MVFDGLDGTHAGLAASLVCALDEGDYTLVDHILAAHTEAELIQACAEGCLITAAATTNPVPTDADRQEHVARTIADGTFAARITRLLLLLAHEYELDADEAFRVELAEESGDITELCAFDKSLAKAVFCRALADHAAVGPGAQTRLRVREVSALNVADVCLTLMNIAHEGYGVTISEQCRNLSSTALHCLSEHA